MPWPLHFLWSRKQTFLNDISMYILIFPLAQIVHDYLFQLGFTIYTGSGHREFYTFDSEWKKVSQDDAKYSRTNNFVIKSAPPHTKHQIGLYNQNIWFPTPLTLAHDRVLCVYSHFDNVYIASTLVLGFFKYITITLFQTSMKEQFQGLWNVLGSTEAAAYQKNTRAIILMNDQNQLRLLINVKDGIMDCGIPSLSDKKIIITSDLSTRYRFYPWHNNTLLIHNNATWFAYWDWQSWHFVAHQPLNLLGGFYHIQVIDEVIFFITARKGFGFEIQWFDESKRVWINSKNSFSVPNLGFKDLSFF